MVDIIRVLEQRELVGLRTEARQLHNAMGGFALNAELADRKWEVARRLLERILDEGVNDATRTAIRELLR
jgi:hypothetical protein